MMISDHAKQRLEERYGFKNDIDIKAILSLFFHKPHFKTIKINDNSTCIRQIRYKEKDVQGAINPIANIILTIIPNFIIWEGNFTGFDSLCDRYRLLLKEKYVLDKEIKIKDKQSKKIIKYKKYIQIGKWFIGREINE